MQQYKETDKLLNEKDIKVQLKDSAKRCKGKSLGKYFLIAAFVSMLVISLPVWFNLSKNKSVEVVHKGLHHPIGAFHNQGGQSLKTRAPCPGLNTLANQGFLPYDGRNITKEILSNALQQGYNFSPSLSSILINTAFEAVGKKENNVEYINLDFLNATAKYKKGLEHDVSLTRRDCPTHDCVSFDQEMFDLMLSFGDENGINAKQLKEYRKFVECEISRKDKNFHLASKGRVAAAGEAAIALAVFGNYESIDRDVLTAFFKEERMPFELGWKRPEKQICLTNAKFSWLLGSFVLNEFTRRC